MNWLKARLLESGRKPIELARHLGLPPSRVYEMLKGERRIQPKEIPKVASFLSLSPAQIVTLMSQGNGIHAVADIPGARGVVETPITVLRATRNQLTGEWTVYNDKAGEVTRPDFMAYANRAFSVTVLDDANSPVYRVRDKVLVDPDTPVTIGDDCLLIAELADEGAPALLGQLVKDEDKHWTLQQYNGGRPRRVAKTKYSAAIAVTGRYICR